MALTTPTPNLLSGPGFLLAAPLGSALPTFVVAGSAFTDSWPVAWVNLGTTTDGTSLQQTQTISPLDVAEFIDHVAYRMTARETKIAFSLAQPTAVNLQRAFNGGTLTVVSGTGATQLAKLTPPTPGQETRLMLGYESADHAIRAIAYQGLNGATVQVDFKKAPNISAVPFEVNCEVSSVYNTPIDFWFAGATAYGS